LPWLLFCQHSYPEKLLRTMLIRELKICGECIRIESIKDSDQLSTLTAIMKIWFRTTIRLSQTSSSIKSNYGLVLSSIFISVIPSSDGINLLKTILTSTMISMTIALHTMMSLKDSRSTNQIRRMLSVPHL